MKLSRVFVLLLAILGNSASAQQPGELLSIIVGYDETKRTLYIDQDEYRLALSARYWSPQRERFDLQKMGMYLGYSAKLKLNEKGDVTDVYVKEAY